MRRSRSYPVLAPVSEGYPKAGAGYSRVTHPFAARVPRRAFPLDLHVLSTPPAFVLSQDQTLQQNLENPWQKCQRTTNTNPHQTRESQCHGNQTNKWHWLNKHPVEFSKNKHTPRPTPPKRSHRIGATSPNYSVGFAVSSPRTSGLSRTARAPTPAPRHHRMSGDLDVKEGTQQTGRGILTDPPARLLPDVLQYPVIDAMPNRHAPQAGAAAAPVIRYGAAARSPDQDLDPGPARAERKVRGRRSIVKSVWCGVSPPRQTRVATSSNARRHLVKRASRPGRSRIAR